MGMGKEQFQPALSICCELYFVSVIAKFCLYVREEILKVVDDQDNFVWAATHVISEFSPLRANGSRSSPTFCEVSTFEEASLLPKFSTSSLHSDWSKPY